MFLNTRLSTVGVAAAVVALATTLTAGSTSAAPTDPTATATITGTVRVPAGHDVEDVAVAVWTRRQVDDGSWAWGQTGPAVPVAADGRYTLPVRAGAHVVWFGFGRGPQDLPPEGALGEEFSGDVGNPAKATPVTVTNGGTATGVDAGLEVGAVLSGTVTDDTGRHLQGAAVEVWQLHGTERQGNWARLPLVETDASGRWRLNGLAVGSYRFAADARHHLFAFHTGTDSPEGDPPLVLRAGEVRAVATRLVRAGDLSGKVWPPSRGNVSRVQVEVRRLDPTTNSWSLVHTTPVLRDGRFAHGLPRRHLPDHGP